MATIDFGVIAEIDPDRNYAVFDDYEAALTEFSCVSIEDEVAEEWFVHWKEVPVSYARIGRRGVGMDQCGVNLVEPESIGLLLEVIRRDSEKAGVPQLVRLLEFAQKKHYHVICFGL